MPLLKESKYLVPSSSYGDVHNYEFFIKELKSHVRASETSSKIGLVIGNTVTYVNNAMEADDLIAAYLDTLLDRIHELHQPAPTPTPVPKKRKR